MEKICVILLVIMTTFHSVKSLNCYKCAVCGKIDELVKNVTCTNAQLCSSIATYISVGNNLSYISRGCFGRNPTKCVDGQTKCDKAICIHCCSSDGCNKDIRPPFREQYNNTRPSSTTRPSTTDKDNNAVSVKTGSVMVLLVLLVLLAMF